jgi:hypothetical protein
LKQSDSEITPSIVAQANVLGNENKGREVAEEEYISEDEEDFLLRATRK